MTLAVQRDGHDDRHFLGHLVTLFIQPNYLPVVVDSAPWSTEFPGRRCTLVSYSNLIAQWELRKENARTSVPLLLDLLLFMHEDGEYD